jgi:hypothetical protein
MLYTVNKPHVPVIAYCALLNIRRKTGRLFLLPWLFHVCYECRIKGKVVPVLNELSTTP